MQASAFTDERRVTRRFSAVALAVYEDDRLQTVDPPHDGGPVTVDEGTERLAGESAAVDSARSASVGD